VLGYGRRRVVLESSMLAADSATRFLARGTKGALIKHRGDTQEAQLKAGLEPGSVGWGHDADPILVLAGEDASPVQLPTPPGDWPRYYALVRDAVRGEGELPVSPPQATTVMVVIEAGLESAASGRVVAPEYTDAERSAWRPVVP
jgi:predicted dehydrogenase